MNLPPAFVNNVTAAFGDPGRRYLADLPVLLDEAAHRWTLTPGEPFLLSYNYVCAVTRADGTPAVLKLGVPNPELTSEMAALQYFDGDGAVRLLEADPERGMCLLEWLHPGEMLAALADDDQRTHLAADVMLRLWRPAPQGLPFIKLSDWFAGLDGLRPRFGGGTGPFPKNSVEMAEALIPELFANSSPPLLIHGDLHHFNILSSERGWLAIDPKGVIGPPEYEVGPLLLNPWNDIKGVNATRITERRIAILSERLDFPRRSLRGWAICHAVLSAWWDIEGNGEGSEYAIACAEVFSQVKV
jgi:streptomycin 6-kinase